MDKATMPEPAAYQDDDGNCWQETSNPEQMTSLITTTQAEAYANARVSEALERAAGIIRANAEACDSGTRIMLRANAEAVLALLPSTPARPESEQ